MQNLLPQAEKARIDPRKLRDYVLNSSHPIGRYKAAFFSQMGFTAEKWKLLERAIREQHLICQATPGHPSPFGLKYTITAPLAGPTGERRWVTSAWIIKTGEELADLVTIEPATRREEPSQDEK